MSQVFRLIKRSIKLILYFFQCLIGFVVFFFRILFFNKSIRSMKKKGTKDTIAILANGPSLKTVLPSLLSELELKDQDYSVLNFFAFDDAFFQIKPKYYCLADPMFFRDTLKSEDVKRLYSILENEVDWKMYIYVPSIAYKTLRKYSKLQNKNLIIVPVNCAEYSGWECLRNFFYKSGFSMPRVQTVANLAVYTALNDGYNTLFLYGFDHTFLETLYVNDDNQLCDKTAHFYDDGKPLLKPIRFEEGQRVRISEYVQAISHMFRSHDQLAAYGRYLNVKIINKTNGSMIDSYDRQ